MYNGHIKMGNFLRKICFCCFGGYDEERKPLLDDTVDATDRFIDENRGPNLLEEHDKIYTIHGERRKHNFKRSRTAKSPRRNKKHFKKRQTGSLYEPLVADTEESDEDDISIPPTKRQLTAMELLQTETSYIRNLKIIIEIYKTPLEIALRKGLPVIESEDIKAIFGGIKEILDVHSDIHKELSDVIESWAENCVIANIITKYQERLTKVYPPYVNYFDMGKDLILKHQKNNPAFTQFLLDCFNNPTCLKQPLDVLLIRPVQRLPSMSLLIKDLQRRTPEEYDDHQELEKAGESLKQVLSHINEDKRKTEGRTKIFDIIYQVDGCPENLVSSNRLYVDRVDVTTMNDGLYRSGERLALFLLTDIIEVTKWKRSPKKNSPLLKHIFTLQLSSIVSLMDITDEDNPNLFGIQLDENEEDITKNEIWKPIEHLCICQPLDDRYKKESWLKSLSNQISINNKVNKEDVLRNVAPNDVQPLLKKGSKIFKKLRHKTKKE